MNIYQKSSKNALRTIVLARLDPKCSQKPNWTPKTYSVPTFGEPFGRLNRDKSIKNGSSFSTRFLITLFIDSGPVLEAFGLHFRDVFPLLFQTCDFLRFLRTSHTVCILLEGPGPPKSRQNRSKNGSELGACFLSAF